MRIAITFVLLFLVSPALSQYSGGSGTVEDPYQIGIVSDWEELMASPTDWDSNFVLTADLDLNGVPIVPVGNDANDFAGIFEGNGHVIRNAVMNMPESDCVGLFGCLRTYGQINHLGVEDISIVGRYGVSGLVGYSYMGSISNCYSTGSASGTGSVDGLVGENSLGLHGRPPGHITNCYSTSRLDNMSVCIGGLVGSSHGVTANSFWDIEISGEPNMCGCAEIGDTSCDNSHGKTTAEMKQQSTFENWDFINVWDIGEGQTYPFLRTHLAGDVNKDGIVNFLDLCIIAGQWMEEGQYAMA